MSNNHNKNQPQNRPFGGVASAQPKTPPGAQTAPVAPAAPSAPEEDVDLDETEGTDTATVTAPPEEPKTPEEPTLASEPIQAPPQAIVVQEVSEGRVSVTPRQNLDRCRIGGTWYSFKKGVSQMVPKDVEMQLKARGII